MVSLVPSGVFDRRGKKKKKKDGLPSKHQRYRLDGRIFLYTRNPILPYHCTFLN